MKHNTGWRAVLPAFGVAVLGLLTVATMTFGMRANSDRIAIVRLPWSASLHDILSATDLAIIDITPNERVVIFDRPAQFDVPSAFAPLHVLLLDGDAALSCLRLFQSAPPHIARASTHTAPGNPIL